MHKAEYLSRKLALEQSEPKFRRLCAQCLQPSFSCYCDKIRSFYPEIDFVILIHPIEARRRIATGRMAHLSLQNSLLVRGQDFSHNLQINEILADPERLCVVLYPGRDSKNLSSLSAFERAEQYGSGKRLTVFVIDGTWLTAKKMMSQSSNLKTLPKISFTLDQVSQFRVRKQPGPGCYSTVEAIYQCIELLAESQNFNLSQRSHEALLRVFEHMVEIQLGYIKLSKQNPRIASYRRELKKSS